MGQWNISIQGHGIHDNGLDHDAEVLTRAFVEQLEDAGHVVTSTHFTVGSARKLRAGPTEEEAENPPQRHRWVDAG